MMSGTLDRGYRAPILVLGLGNKQQGDDGLGPALLKNLANCYPYAGGLVEFVDGGTQGLNLLRRVAGRQALVVLDAVSADLEPGTVSVLEGSDVVRFATGSTTTAHEGNVGELLATAAFLGDLPSFCYGLRLSDEYAEFDANRVFDLHLIIADEPAECISAQVLQGLRKPTTVRLSRCAVHPTIRWAP